MRETCSCGASLEVRASGGRWATDALEGFRVTHETCRDRTAALDAVYAERNQVVLALAAAVDADGYDVGTATDPEAPGWVVLLIDGPGGQVSWHFRPEDIPPGIPEYPGKWDGHTSEEKYARLKQGYPEVWG